MEGVVLAGVHAWGECVLESVMCRPLFPVAGLPLIAHTLEWLREGGIRKVNVCANSDTAALYRCLGSGRSLGLTLHYYEDRMPRGPAGCARDAMFDGGEDTLVVVEGTLLPQLDFAALVRSHRASGAALTVAVSGGEPANAGDARAERLEPVGVYVFSCGALAYVPPTGYQDIKEALIPRLYAAGERVGTYIVPGPGVPRVTNAASYLGACHYAVEHLAASESTPAGYVRIKEAVIHESVRLHATVRFIGPVHIGPQCRLEEDAMIIGPTAIGSNCVIGRQAVVGRSVLWSSCRVEAGAILDRCVLTDGVDVKPEQAVRETVCLAQPSRRTWADRFGSMIKVRRATKRTITIVPSAGKVFSPSKSKGQTRQSRRTPSG